MKFKTSPLFVKTLKLGPTWDWKFLPFNFRARHDLKAPDLIEAAPEWNFWEFSVTCGLFISGSNTYFVRKRVKQHPHVSKFKESLIG